MSDTVIRVENVSKLYRLGELGTGTLAHDLNRWWHRLRGKEDPYTKVGQVNDRTRKADSDWVWALKDINFDVKRGEVLGIIGRNGAGKSTLLKILSRVTAPTTGKVKVKGRIASLLEVGTGFHPELSGRENIFLNGAILGMKRTEVAAKLDEIVEFSGCTAYLDTPVKRYSSGMYVRLAFAVAAHLEPDVLIVDEVLAVGDAQFQEKCLGKLRQEASQGRAVLFVTHNLSSVTALCSTSILLTNGTIACQGNVPNVLSVYSAVPSSDSEASFPPVQHKPCITQIHVDRTAAANGDLQVHVHFQSPRPLSPPVVGVIVNSLAGTPVFGSNPRFHSIEEVGPIDAGVASLRVPRLPLAPGKYKVSVWLGDWHEDFDHRPDAVSFEFRHAKTTSHRPNSSVIGFIDCPANWTVTPAEMSTM